MMLRLARLADAAAIARVHVASWHTAYAALIPAERLQRFTLERRTLAWRSNLAGTNAHTVVFDRQGGGIAGFASSGASRSVPGWGEIWALYVDPAAWGAGIGSALFADAMGHLAASGWSRVLIWVLEGNDRAVEFYRGNGFVLDGTRAVEDGYPQIRMRR